MQSQTGGPMPDVDLPVEQRKIIRRSAAAALFCGIVLGGGYVLMPRFVTLPSDPVGCLAFALRADVFILFWIVIGGQMVASGRFRSKADNRGSAFAPPSPRIAIPVAFLQNTLEQAVMAVGAHLALATLLSGPALSLLASSVALFAVGRVTFLIGYPKGAGGRAFGMATTALPTLCAYLLAIVLIVGRVVG